MYAVQFSFIVQRHIKNDCCFMINVLCANFKHSMFYILTTCHLIFTADQRRQLAKDHCSSLAFFFSGDDFAFLFCFASNFALRNFARRALRNLTLVGS